MYLVRIFSKLPIGKEVRKIGKAGLTPWYYLGKLKGNYIYEIEVDDLEKLNYLTGCTFSIKGRLV